MVAASVSVSSNPSLPTSLTVLLSSLHALLSSLSSNSNYSSIDFTLFFKKRIVTEIIFPSDFSELKQLQKNADKIKRSLR